jgi:hypothetical protein
MRNVPIKVELIGLLPEVYRVCVKCQPMDYLSLGGVDYVSEQLAGYPEEIRVEQKKLLDLYHRLQRDFPGAVLPVPIGLMSPRGLWLSLRHRFGNGPKLLIGGTRVLSADRPYEEIKRTIEEELTKSG